MECPNLLIKAFLCRCSWVSNSAKSKNPKKQVLKVWTSFFASWNFSWKVLNFCTSGISVNARSTDIQKPQSKGSLTNRCRKWWQAWGKPVGEHSTKSLQYKEGKLEHSTHVHCPLQVAALPSVCQTNTESWLNTKNLKAVTSKGQWVLHSTAPSLYLKLLGSTSRLFQIL